MSKSRLTLIVLAISFLALLPPRPALSEVKKDPFVGTYHRTFTGASGQVKETLVLKQNLTCALKSTYPGSNRKPIVMNGTWSKAGSLAKVSWKTGGQADNISFKLQGNQLIATEYDHSNWGAELKYERLR